MAEPAPHCTCPCHVTEVCAAETVRDTLLACFRFHQHQVDQMFHDIAPHSQPERQWWRRIAERPTYAALVERRRFKG